MAKSHSQKQNKDLSQEEGIIIIKNVTATVTDNFHKQMHLREFYEELNPVLTLARYKMIA